MESSGLRTGQHPRESVPIRRARPQKLHQGPDLGISALCPLDWATDHLGRVHLEKAPDGKPPALHDGLPQGGLARRVVMRKKHDAVLAEVEALGGEPGVLSARYAGEYASDSDRLEYLLGKLKGVPERERTARFRCVIASPRRRAGSKSAPGHTRESSPRHPGAIKGSATTRYSTSPSWVKRWRSSPRRKRTESATGRGRRQRRENY